MSTLKRITWMVVLASIAACGCGSDDEQVAQPAKKVEPAVPPKPGRPVERKKRKLDRKQAIRQFGPSVDPKDIFETVPGGPRFTIVGQEPIVKPSDWFFAVTPVDGADSSTFVVIDKPQRASAGNPHPEFQLPTGFQPITDAGYSPQGLPLQILCEQDDSNMVLVPGGVSLVGKPDGPPEVQPQLEVFLPPFYIDATEITLDQYERFRSAREEMKRRVPPEPLNASQPSNFPALGVSWTRARIYAGWAGKALPSEPEWEKAARGEHGFEYTWGSGRAIWSRRRTTDQIDAVRSFRTDVSPYGLYDMAGNAREWCSDRFSKQSFQAAAATGPFPIRRWRGPRATIAEGDQRVVKGNGPNWVAWHRSGLGERERSPAVGFRCVLRVSLPQATEDAEGQE